MAYVYRGGWIASLSNGETVFETKRLHAEITSWQTLLARLKDQNLRMTALHLTRNGIKLHAAPSWSVDGYWMAYEMTYLQRSQIETKKQGIGSVVGDKVYIVWLSLDDFQITQEVRALDTCIQHSTL